MSNITPTNAAAFIPEIWANQALPVLRQRIVLAKLITQDSDIATFAKGSTLHIPVVGSFTANDKTPGSPVTLQAPSDSTVSVTLNKHKEATFLVEDVTKAQENANLMNSLMEGQIKALANQIEDDIFALYAGFSQSVGTSGTDIGAAEIRSAKKALFDATYADDVFGVISSKDEMALLGDSTITQYLAYNQQNIKEGSIGRIYGFDVYASQRVPAVGSSPVSTKNIFGHKDMAILAMRALPTPNVPGVSSTVVRDPESGLVLRVTATYNPSYLGVQVTMDVLYGVAQLRDAAAVVALS